jgi:hypothetical protein
MARFGVDSWTTFCRTWGFVWTLGVSHDSLQNVGFLHFAKGPLYPQWKDYYIIGLGRLYLGTGLYIGSSLEVCWALNADPLPNKNNERFKDTQAQLVQTKSMFASQEVQPHHVSALGRVHSSTTTRCVCSSIVI